MNEYEFLKFRIEEDLFNKFFNIKFYYKGFYNYIFKVDYEGKIC